MHWLIFHNDLYIWWALESRVEEEKKLTYRLYRRFLDVQYWGSHITEGSDMSIQWKPNPSMNNNCSERGSITPLPRHPELACIMSLDAISKIWTCKTWLLFFCFQKRHHSCLWVVYGTAAQIHYSEWDWACNSTPNLWTHVFFISVLNQCVFIASVIETIINFIVVTYAPLWLFSKIFALLIWWLLAYLHTLKNFGFTF